MESRFFVLLFLLLWNPLAIVAQEVSSPQEPGEIPPYGQVFYGTDQPYKITIQSDRGVVLVLEVPQGVFLSVEYDAPRVPSEDQRTFRGDVIIRTRREDELSATESRFAHDIMAKAPVDLALTHVVVAVEPLGKKEEVPQPK